MVPFKMMVYLEDEDKYYPDDEVPKGARVLNISGTELRQRLNEGRDIPSWFTYPEVVQELRRSYPPRHKQGVTIFFTGLSGSGKSTIANVLMTKFLETGRPSGHVAGRRPGAQTSFVANSASPRSIATSTFAASVTWRRRSPRMAASRFALRSRPTTRLAKHVRGLIEPLGGFILVHVATSHRSMRAARPQRPVRQGARRHPEGVHRHFRSLRRTERCRSRHQHRRVDSRGGRAGDHSASGAGRLRRRQSASQPKAGGTEGSSQESPLRPLRLRALTAKFAEDAKKTD